MKDNVPKFNSINPIPPGLKKSIGKKRSKNNDYSNVSRFM